MSDKTARRQIPAGFMAKVINQSSQNFRIAKSESGLKDDDGLKDRVSPLRSGQGQGRGSSFNPYEILAS
jgi:hypothetical protein